MRYFGISALVACTMMVSACGGGENTPATESSPTPDASANVAAPAAGAMAPITGTIHEVNMVMDAKGYRFDPEKITIKAGDGIKYINVSGGPHDIAFDAAQPALENADVKAQLAANMPNSVSELHGPMLMQPNEAYTISFGNIPPGTYEINCPVHIAMNMRQTIVVE